MKNIIYWLLLSMVMANSAFAECKDGFTMEISDYNNYNFKGNAHKETSSFVINSNAQFALGAFWYNSPIRLVSGFETEFSFKISDPKVNGGNPDGSYAGADGFAFVIQTMGNDAIGVTGGCMGYNQIRNAFVVEFDMYRNTNELGLDWRDPNGNHIAVQYAKNSRISPEHKPQYSLGTCNTDIEPYGTEYFCKLVYDSSASVFEIYLNTTNSFTTPILSIPNFKLEDYIELPNGMAYLGFTGATGTSTEKHEIMTWEVCPKDTIEQVGSGDCDTAYFNYPNFANIDGLKISERAYQRDSKIRIAPSGNYNKGAIWRDREVPVKNGFETNWTFSTSSPLLGKYPDKSEAGADGFAFVIHNSKDQLNAIGTSGGGIGYAGIDNCLAIELDLFSNDEYQLQTQYDPNGNHIAVMKCSPTTTINALHTAETQVAVSTDIPIIKSNGTLYYAKIKYDGAAKDLKIWITDAPVFNEPNIHLTNFDLSKYVSLINGAKAYVGITSATGDASQNHDIFNWQFCPTVYDAPMNGVEDEMSSPLVTPNPATDRITINLPEDCRNHDKTLIEIYDMLGKLVYSQNISNGQSSNDIIINTEGFTPGVYIVNINSGLVNLSEKFVVEKK